jgi:hypothetical protein
MFGHQGNIRNKSRSYIAYQRPGGRAWRIRSTIRHINIYTTRTASIMLTTNELASTLQEFIQLYGGGGRKFTSSSLRLLLEREDKKEKKTAIK